MKETGIRLAMARRQRITSAASAATRDFFQFAPNDVRHLESRRSCMVLVMYGVVLLIVFIAVAVAAMKDTRLAGAAADHK